MVQPEYESILLYFVLLVASYYRTKLAKSDELHGKRKGQNLNSKFCPFFAPEAGLEPATL